LSAKRVECRLAALAVSENAADNFIKIVQCVAARIAVVSKNLAIGRELVEPTGPGPVIGW
jgi:hypothetical protein